MTSHRRKLWLSILEDLGPPEGCIVPTWLRLVYTMLFPLRGLKCLAGVLGFDPLRMVWRIHGIEFSDHMFVRLAASNGEIYRFTSVNGVMTVEQVTTTTTTESIEAWTEEEGIMKPVVTHVHVIPIESGHPDLLHCAQQHCWCSPVVHKEDPRLIVHNAMTAAPKGWVRIAENRRHHRDHQ